MARISIISPCYNDGENVEACYRAMLPLFAPGGPLAQHEPDHIFADNVSEDGTVAILRRPATADQGLEVILNARNFGSFRAQLSAPVLPHRQHFAG